MDTNQHFGGTWTIEKLDILSEYLNFYVTALKNYKFKKIYIDAFAGSGEITLGKGGEIIEGSTRLALKAKTKFDRYLFIEKKKEYSDQLRQTIDAEFSDYKDIISIFNGDCNEVLRKICNDIDWKYNRAILFLDPYATEVNWETLKTIAITKAIDVWYLFPFSAVNRLMKNNGEIEASWREVLNRIFGDDSWEQEFYKEDQQTNLFGDINYFKDVSVQALSNYVCKRLKTIFPDVCKTPRVLYNSKNSPLFLFCFAVSNDSPKAISLALKVANHILKLK
jgi:three-Cys-motif partner protein